MIGRKLSNFHINERIGEGGMGTVYKATDLHLNRTVAIKMLHPFLVSNPDSFKRFRNEAHLSARISHPNVATLFNFQEVEDTHFIIMEYVKGQALDDILALQGRLPEAEAAKIMLQVLEGLGAAHELGIMHRDLKPGNIMITHRGFVKLMDFGIARLENTERMTRQNSVIGTLEYLSPELIKGGAPSKASDLYAVGVMFYEMLSGQSLFSGETEAAVMYQIAHEKAKVQIPGANKRLVQVIKKLVHKDPNKRYQSTQAVINDLEQLYQAGKVNTRMITEKVEHQKSDSSPRIALPVQFSLPKLPQFKAIQLPFDVDLRILAGALLVCLLIVVIGRSGGAAAPKNSTLADHTEELSLPTERENEDLLPDITPVNSAQLGQPTQNKIEFLERFEDEPSATDKASEKKTQKKTNSKSNKTTKKKESQSDTRSQKRSDSKTQKKNEVLVKKEAKPEQIDKTTPSKPSTIIAEEEPIKKEFAPRQIESPDNRNRRSAGEAVKIRIPDMFLSAAFAETVSSEKNYEGQQIYLSTTSDIFQGDHLIIPRGARVKATVKKVRKAQGKKRAFLAIDLLSVQAINGQWLTISYPEYSNLSKNLVEFKRGSQLNRIKLKSTNITLNKSF